MSVEINFYTRVTEAMAQAARRKLTIAIEHRGACIASARKLRKLWAFCEGPMPDDPAECERLTNPECFAMLQDRAEYVGARVSLTA